MARSDLQWSFPPQKPTLGHLQTKPCSQELTKPGERPQSPFHVTARKHALQKTERGTLSLLPQLKAIHLRRNPSSSGEEERCQVPRIRQRAMTQASKPPLSQAAKGALPSPSSTSGQHSREEDTTQQGARTGLGEEISFRASKVKSHMRQNRKALIPRPMLEDSASRLVPAPGKDLSPSRIDL